MKICPLGMTWPLHSWTHYRSGYLLKFKTIDQLTSLHTTLGPSVWTWKTWGIWTWKRQVVLWQALGKVRKENLKWIWSKCIVSMYGIVQEYIKIIFLKSNPKRSFQEVSWWKDLKWLPKYHTDIQNKDKMETMLQQTSRLCGSFKPSSFNIQLWSSIKQIIFKMYSYT